MVGKTIGNYTIIRELGRGGMGVVYLARELELDRDVAFKVLLTEDDSDSEAVRRFLREAKFASSVTHPNIVTVYEIGEVPPVRYVAMEYIEGLTLRHKMQEKIAVSDAVKIARQVARALQAAQTRGIVHRDIKPENIMLTGEGHVKVLDFGLARRNPHAEPDSFAHALLTETQLTKPQQVMGTVAYMSPEQLAGRATDGRSDIFAAGVVLYEMLAGRRPFAGPSSSELIAQIMSAEPDPLARFNYEVPPALDMIVRKCLEKDVSRRYQTAGELAIDLSNLDRDIHSGRISAYSAPVQSGFAPGTALQPQAFSGSLIPSRPLAGGAAQLPHSDVSFAPVPLQLRNSSRRHALLAAGALLSLGAVGAGFWIWRGKSRDVQSLGVLPFTNASGDPGLDYLAEGLGDGVLDDLTRLPDLKVISQSAVQKYRGKTPDPVAAGRDLSVDTILNGRITRSEGLLNVRLELVATPGGNQLWSRVYKRPVQDVSGLQQALSQDVANELRPSARASVRGQHSANSESYELYLKGRHELRRRTPDSIHAATRYLQQASEKDPSFALAYSGLAEAYAVIGMYGYQPPVQVLGQARSAAQRAIELDSRLSEAHVALAISLVAQDYRWTEAEREYQRAIALNPANPEARLWYAMSVLSPRGRMDEALIQVDHLLEAEPKDVQANMTRAVILYFGRRYDKAIEQFQFMEKLVPGFVYARLHLALALSETPRRDAAVAVLEDPHLTEQVPVETQCLLGAAYASTGRADKARALAKSLADEARRTYVAPYGRAMLATCLGDKETALDLLDQAVELRDHDTLFLNVDPKLDPLRGHKRFDALLRRLQFV